MVRMYTTNKYYGCKITGESCGGGINEIPDCNDCTIYLNYKKK